MSVCRLRWQSKLKTIGHAIKCDTFIISCNSNLSYTLTCQKKWEKRPKRPKLLENDNFFVGFSTPVCWPRSQSKLKSIVHATTCGTIIISHKSNISHSLPVFLKNCRIMYYSYVLNGFYFILWSILASGQTYEDCWILSLFRRLGLFFQHFGQVLEWLILR